MITKKIQNEKIKKPLDTNFKILYFKGNRVILL
jgi:hypothetical protein